MRCSSCQQDNPDAARFCGQCGRALEARVSPCAACGIHNPPANRFCHACGAALSAPGAPSASRPPAAYTPPHLARRILTSRSALEGERKQVTVLFADVEGSLELAQRIDPEAWHRILDRFFQILTSGVHRFEGTINQYTGDGIMALFGAPLAHEDHAPRACYAALHLRDEVRRYSEQLARLQQLEFSVRMGINSGDVVVGKIGDDLRMDYTAQGHTVGLAARMEQLAGAGEIFVSPPTARAVEGLFELRERGAFRVTGIPEPVQVASLERTGPLRTRLDVARARGFTRFVGREEAMERLEREAMQTAGRVLGIVGEPGVGKSRLCFEFLERWRERSVVLHRARCAAHGRTIPYLPLLDLLRCYFAIDEHESAAEVREKVVRGVAPLGPEFRGAVPLLLGLLGVADPQRPAAPVDPAVQRRWLVGVLRRLVLGQRGPSLLLIDDLQWIDPDSDAFLAELVEEIHASRILLLLNFRPEYHAPWMREPVYRSLPLGPLGSGAMRELIEALLGRDGSLGELPGQIRERTAGNPFFAEELVRSLAESDALEGERGRYRVREGGLRLALPASVQPVLAARIDRLPEREKQVLQVASVFGRDFGEAALQRVTRLPQEELVAVLSALREAEFLYESLLYPRAQYAFVHPLTQEVAYCSQLAAARQRIHASVALALEETAERLGECASLIAHHWEAAKEPEEAARWHRRAALEVTHIRLRRRRSKPGQARNPDPA